MRVTAKAGREYWRDVLGKGGFATIPRWSAEPRTGLDAHATTVDEGLATRLRELARDLDVPLTSVLLAAHATVLAALTGEREVVTGYLTKADHAVPCRLNTEFRSWAELIRATHRNESELLTYQDFPVDGLRHELDLAGPPFETEFDLIGHHEPLAHHTVMRVELAPRGREITVTIRYRTEAFDEACASRMAGYHLTALGLMTADPDAEPGRQRLMSPEEHRFQIDGLAGPTRELPDRRFHELFEQRVRHEPDAVAVVFGDGEWTYAELNARANRLGRALLARGLTAETVVAVVTERNPDWMSAVLAIFKAGGVYLPIEPHFPADRIATTLSRAGCDLVVTEAGSRSMLDEALATLPDVRTLPVEDVDGEGHADDDLGVAVAADQLAYIYFTSGSTGAPKGAMCEHAGMLNHLYAKIDDLEIGDGQTVAQVAPQCFDISLWQLVSALLVGGRTLLIDQETILEPRRFLDTVVERRVGVLQVVPSYLEVLLTYLEQHPRDLPDLHCVSVTGEAVTLELVQRWFAAEPEIKLANAYGLTETSDDTNHEVMTRAPDRGGVPLGRAINNTHVYVVDEHLAPVPLGAPGEIVFSGVCVGRGYINDPDRTRLAYVHDPHREGERLYRSGDYGRWRPDGKLEFLGRRDAQVKIRGFRIEIGEIENAMLHVPAIRQSSVVITDQGERTAQLVAFYSGEHLDADELASRLGRSLPDYMVPSTFHWREQLPLTGNGKVDRKTLTAMAQQLATADADVDDSDAPATDAERRLAAAFAGVLGIAIDQVGRHDDFFDRGGTSLMAVELVIAMDSAVSLKEVTRHPVLADLARLLDSDESPAAAGLLQQLSEPGEQVDAALVCFPYAGGNAVNFRAMSRALAGSGLAVHAVELPGHDLTAETEPFAAMDDVIDQVVAEIEALASPRVMLWGHSSGAALALATARRLEQRGVDVERVFIGAQLLRDADGRMAEIRALRVRNDAEIASGLRADGGYTELGDLDRSRALQVGAAFRHDCLAAHHYFVEQLEDPPSVKLAAPVTVVVAADDPITIEWPSRHTDWQLLADQVDVHELGDGGHYFLRTRPTEAADAVLRATTSVDLRR